MPDPFATALAALFSAPGSVAAVYTAPGAAPVSLRVIKDYGRQLAGGDRIIMDTDKVQIMRSDVAKPVSGAKLVIGDDRFTLQGSPQLDVEGLSWSCELQPA